MTGTFTEDDFDFGPRFYSWTSTALAFLERVLKVDIQLHAEDATLEEGEIFLFNHFARFETFIPAYLLYKRCGAMSRMVASPEFFEGSDAASVLLRGLGAVPNDYEKLLPFLASEIVRGRKIIIFPEGGIVKDRRVLDHKGGYSVFSRTAMERRKHHTGAAVLANAVEVFKEAVRSARNKGQEGRLHRWTEDLGEGGRERLFSFADRPTVIIPANITFFPIRADENLVHRAAELIAP